MGVTDRRSAAVGALMPDSLSLTGEMQAKNPVYNPEKAIAS
jgi:hypothetical protein